nr:YkgJ family cysteine cluster protein [Pseudomonas sp. BN607]
MCCAARTELTAATTKRVSVTFVAFTPGPCRNLDDNDLCIIYEQRPFVCRT